MTIPESHMAGIDFGARMAGTTAISYVQDEKLYIVQSSPKSDADQWLDDMTVKNHWNLIFLDAPLSLPYGCLGKGCDFTYRKGDRLTNAMSPMFLGGLTARAMSHAYKWRTSGIQVMEAYPGYLIRQFPELKVLYQKKQLSSLPAFAEELRQKLPLEVATDINNYHQADSLLCWYTGYRYLKGEAIAAGDEEEGLIWI
jgi:predicted nuclease with RNAse H fold